MNSRRFSMVFCWSIGIAVAFGILMLVLPTAVRADTLIVTNANDSGPGSLRQAVADAAPGDTIIFDGDYAIYLTSTLTIDKQLTIDGSGHAIKVSGDTGNDGSRNVRVFSINASRGVTLSHLSIVSGTTTGVGGGIYNDSYSLLTVQNSTVSGSRARLGQGGGIYNDYGGTLTVQNSTLSGNRADLEGGSIYNFGTLTVQNSTIFSNSTGQGGGGIHNVGTLTVQDGVLSGNNGSGIYNSGTLTVQNSAVSGNNGDGIYNEYGMLMVTSSTVSSNGNNGINNYRGTLTVINSTVSGNNGRGIHDLLGTLTVQNSTFSGNSVSGIYNSGTMTVQNGTIFSNSTSSSGGGIYNSGTLTVQNSTVFSNSTSQEGGGIFNFNGTLTVQNSTISGNSASSRGGGISNALGTLTVTNSTLSGNLVSFFGQGGGIYNDGYSTLTVQNSTVFSNSASYDGGGIYNISGTLTVQNSLIGNNSASSGSDCSGTLTSQDYNLIENTAGCTINGITTHNIIGQDPQLGPLADNGGGTWTQALLPGSPALDHIPYGTNGCGVAYTQDQRGVARPYPMGGACDIGAYEATPQLSLAKSVTPVSHVPYHGVVTYIVVLSNTGALSDTNVLLTDTLPAGVAFGQWVEQPGSGVIQNGNAITWTGTLTNSTALTFTFTATHIGDYREWVTNTALFSGTAQAGSAAAGFQVMAYLIMPTAGAGGSITPSAVQVVNQGEDRVFTITPNVSYHSLDVGVDGASVGVVNVYTFTNITADHTITAAFAIDTFVITPTAGAGGSITPGTPQTVSYGASQTFTITPNVGYHILDVGVDSASVGIVNVYSFTNVTADHTITAAFAINTFVITPTAGAGGSITPDTPQTVNYGASQTFTITPNVGHHILDVGVDGASVGAVSVHTFTNVTADHTITATFAINTYTLTMATASNGSGVVTPTVGTHPYLYGDVVTLEAMTNTGSTFTGWSGDVVTITNPLTLTMDADKTVTATFNLAGACVPVGGLSVALSPFAPLVGQTVTFTGTVAAGTTPITYTWSWGDGSLDLQGLSAVATHTFPLTATRQTYTITLTAANVCPSSATTQQPVAVAPYTVYLPVVIR